MKTSIPGRFIIALFLGLFAAGGCSPDYPDYTCPDSNIILISFDTLRADHLGCYGYDKDTSPHTDAFSKDCVLFEKTIAQSSTTKSSHASIFTGMNVVAHCAYGGNDHILSDDRLTMAEILKDQGYRTICYNSGGYMREFFKLDQGFEIYNSDVVGRFINTVNISQQWLDDNPGEKFFLFMHTYEVHHPYLPKEPFSSMFKNDYSGPLPDHITIELLKDINAGKVTIDEADKAHIISRYDAEIRSMDDAFGKFLAYLKSKGLYDKAIIIVTSDHGEEFGEHGKMGWHSHTLYEELIHVPLLIKFPDQKFKGKRIKGMVRSIDILPTLLQLLAIDIGIRKEAIEGVSLLRGIQKGKVDSTFALSQLGTNTSALQNDRFKIIANQLYDLKNDPGEQKNIANENKKIRDKMHTSLQSYLKAKANAIETKSKVDEETLEELRKLGYVD